MESKFKVGDKAIIANHPKQQKLIGMTVFIKQVGYGKFSMRSDRENQNVYRVQLPNGRKLGWAPEEDLKEIEKANDSKS